MLVAQESCRVEQFVKQPDGRWIYAVFTAMEDRVQLASVVGDGRGATRPLQS